MPRGFRQGSVPGLISAGSVFLIALLFASSGEAAEAQRPSIQFTLAASPPTAVKVSAVLRDSFARRSWVLELRTVPSIDPHAIAARGFHQPQSSAWLDLVGPRKALYLVDENQGLVYTRELDVHESPDAVELELVTFVVESSIEAMQAGDIRGVPRAEFERQLAALDAAKPPSADAAASPPKPPARTKETIASPAQRGARLALAGGYHGELIGDLVFGHGLFVAARWQPLRLGLEASLRTQWPVHVTDADLDVRLWSSDLRLRAALPVPIGQHVVLQLGLGGGWEVTRVVPADGGGVAPFWASAPLLSGFAAVERSWGRFFVSMRLDLDVELIRVRYRTRRAGGTSTDWRPHLLRPSAAALVGVRF